MMDPDTRQNAGSRTALQLAVGLVSAVAALLLLTLLALNAFDVFAVLLLCGLVVLLERNVGDWFADQLGDMAFKVFLIAFVGALGWAALGTDIGRASVLALLRAAYERGFESAVVSIDAPVLIPPPPTSATSAQVAPAIPRAPRPSSPNTAPLRTTNPLPRPDAPSRSRETHERPAAGPDDSAAASLTRPSETVTVRAISTTPAGMVLRAQVMAGLNNVTSGVVEFSVNGTVMTRVPLGSDGRAEARIGNLTPGSYRVIARYAGNQLPDGPVEGALLCIATNSRPVNCSYEFDPPSPAAQVEYSAVPGGFADWRRFHPAPAARFA